MVAKRTPTEQDRDKARKEFYRIVKERLDARIERGEAYTSTKDLYKGYESLHDEGFSDTQFIAASVAQVLSRSEYRDRLFYARHSVTHKAERVGPGKSAPYKVYLRPDATPPKDYVLVPISAKRSEIPEYVAMQRGAEDATVHVSQNGHQEPVVQEQPAVMARAGIDYREVSAKLADIVAKQNELIVDMLPLLDMLKQSTEEDLVDDEVLEAS